MLLAGRGTELKAKLTQKGGKYLPTASVMKLMPAGTGSLNEVPNAISGRMAEIVSWPSSSTRPRSGM